MDMVEFNTVALLHVDWRGIHVPHIY